MTPTGSKLGRGKALKNQSKELLIKLYRYFEGEIERDPNATVTAMQLVTQSTGVSAFTLKRILAEKKKPVKVNITGKRRKKNIAFDVEPQAIRRIIYNLYSQEEFPCMKDLHLLLKAELDYLGSIGTMRRHIAKLGFKLVEKANDSTILLEKHEIRYSRVQFLTKIDFYRGQGRNVVYIGESFIESTRTSSIPRLDGSSTTLKQPAKSRFTILLAGDQADMMKSTLFVYDSKKDVKEEHYCVKDSFEHHDKWLKSQLMPNLKPNSIVVVDGGSSLYSRLITPSLHFNSKKMDMIDYLTAKNVPCSIDMYKAQLYQLVMLNKDKHNEYKVDIMLREDGHTVLRLPHYHPDLNPIKNILEIVKNYLGKDVLLSAKSITKIAKEKIYSITEEDWKLVNKSAEAEENNLKAMDKVIDEMTEGFFRGNAEESESSDDGNALEQETDSD